MKITYEEFSPSADLAPYVECYWVHSFTGESGEDSPVQRCLPLGMVEVIIHPDENISDLLTEEQWQQLPRSFFHGIYNNPVYWKIKSNARLFGIRFKPETFSTLFNVPAASLYCHFVSLETFLGREVSGLHRPLYGIKDIAAMVAHCDGFLSKRLADLELQHNYITEAADIIRHTKGNISIEEVSNSISVSMRQLQRSFKENLGTTPKGYLRIIRFRNAFSALESEHEWADITYDLGYADQAHFIREFREFAGDTPNSIIRNAENIRKKPFSFTDSIFL
ncbi:AraC family transcriptional regulator [Flavobacterium sp. DGU11]|uniref:AraC family transcriptional regulator n=1 Tax=Flavobacterium arundinis TaxID=3139143 RepID=A0ABU9I0D3_9FLAO